MKKTLSLAALAASAIAMTAAPALAEDAKSGAYASLGYTQLDGDDNTDVGAATVRFTMRANKYLGAEGEFSTGIRDKEQTILGVPVKAQLENAFGIYGVGFLPLGEKFDLFARVGYGSVTVKATAAGLTAEQDASGIAGGVGAQFMFTNRVGVRGEYTRQSGDDGDADLFGVSGVLKF